IAEKGSISLSDDGTHYTIINTIGAVAPNDIFEMHFSPNNTFFFSALAFEGFINSSTFDPDESNNTAILNADFNFNMPATYELDLLNGNGIILDTPYDYQINSPQDGMSMRFRIGYDEPDCTVPFWNGKLTLTVPNIFGSATIEGSSGGAS